MATKYPEVDSTSGLGSLPPEENVHRDFEETLTTEPTEAEADRGGTHAVLQESYDREIWRLQGKGVSKLTLKGIDSHKVTVSESKFQPSSSTPAFATERTWPLYSDGQDVPRERVEHMRNSGKGKSNEVRQVTQATGYDFEVRQIYSKLADQLQEFEGGEDCYLLPIENGILFSKKKIAKSKDNVPDSVCVEHEPRRGKVFLNGVLLAATVTQDSSIYRRKHVKLGLRGNFLILPEDEIDVLGRGNEATVLMANDVLTGDKLAVKKMEISEKMLSGSDPFAAFLKLAGCEQT
ncbi:PREDICTED: uncharacterized protein LOC109482299 [Branchiostoma belcheri]|uniref:Uncharacterized protein LOC109482299 n=1 Tax=Branchiostoma belcheri TaxID=7741 RepID=A0A6P4ZUI3_BRABE|nr:PREDICTED: uncharacterized protein LOC109482299 [Branchiostoma belcheri]